MTWGQARLVHNCFISLDSRDCDNVVMLATAGAGADEGRHLIALLRVHSTSSLLLLYGGVISLSLCSLVMYWSLRQGRYSWGGLSRF